MPHKEFIVTGVGAIKIYKRRGNRNIRLTVTASGDVRVTMPPWAPYQAGVAFALSKRDWILSQGSNSVPVLTNGMRIGKSHHLVFQQTSAILDTPKTSVRQTEIIITYGRTSHSADPAVQAAAQAACLRALRSQAKTLLGQRLIQLANKHSRNYRSLAIKRMKSRWGSCDQEQNIVLNLYLIQLPWDLIDYVILHELAHTKILHHGSGFWEEFESLLPKARELRRAIRAYRPALRVA